MSIVDFRRVIGRIGELEDELAREKAAAHVHLSSVTLDEVLACAPEGVIETHRFDAENLLPAVLLMWQGQIHERVGLVLVRTRDVRADENDQRFVRFMHFPDIGFSISSLVIPDDLLEKTGLTHRVLPVFNEDLALGTIQAGPELVQVSLTDLPGLERPPGFFGTRPETETDTRWIKARPVRSWPDWLSPSTPSKGRF